VGDALYFMVRGGGSYGTTHLDATSAASAMRCNQGAPAFARLAAAARSAAI